jgi:hypothetical protein
VQLAINNSGSSSLRNLYIEILVKLVSGKASVPNRVEKEITEKQKNQFFSSDGFLLDSTSDSASIAENGNLLRFSFEWPAIQPRLVKSIEPLLHFQAEENSVIAITARVFADSFREPVELQSKLHIDVAQSDITLEKYFGKVDINTRSTFSGQSKIANFLQCFFEKDPGVRQDTILGFDDEFISEVLRHLSDKKFDAQKKGTEG